jgi:hypothetical protein
MHAPNMTIGLVVSYPIPIANPTRVGLEAAASTGRFDRHGYKRLWIVDAEGWVARVAG